VQGIVGVAETVPGPLGLVTTLFNTLFGWIANLFDCTGTVVVGNVVYAPDTLNNLTQHQKICETKPYIFASPHDACGKANSSYIVTYCLERLDAPPVPKSIAVKPLPGFGMFVLSLAVASLLENYGGLM
jgi:hypothetical protein